MRKCFTPEEEEYIQDFYGTKSAESIGKRLGISAQSVISKAQKMGLTSLINASGKITANNLASLVGRDVKVVLRWMDHGLPHVRRALSKNKARKHILIEPKDFWKWAEQNKDRVDFLRIERNTILPEPEWVEEERNKLRKNPKKTSKIWTAQEEVRLWNMYYTSGMRQKEIAERFGVTPMSIEKKLQRLRAKGGQSYISSISA